MAHVTQRVATRSIQGLSVILDAFPGQGQGFALEGPGPQGRECCSSALRTRHVRAVSSGGWGDGGYRVGVGGLGLCHPTPSNLKNILDTASRIIFLPLCH